MKFKNISVIADSHADAQSASALLAKSVKSVPPDNADVVIALGGDGFMLSTIHSFIGKNCLLYTSPSPRDRG